MSFSRFIAKSLHLIHIYECIMVKAKQLKMIVVEYD